MEKEPKKIDLELEFKEKYFHLFGFSQDTPKNISPAYIMPVFIHMLPLWLYRGYLSRPQKSIFESSEFAYEMENVIRDKDELKYYCSFSYIASTVSYPDKIALSAELAPLTIDQHTLVPGDIKKSFGKGFTFGNVGYSIYEIELKNIHAKRGYHVDSMQDFNRNIGFHKDKYTKKVYAAGVLKHQRPCGIIYWTNQ